jgi:glycosyltransferase involved in cell wall biosynthesis
VPGSTVFVRRARVIRAPDRKAASLTNSYGFLSTYPPTQCGLATFTSALARSLTVPPYEDRAGVVRVLDTAVTSRAPEVVGHMQIQASGSPRAAAELLNSFDVAVIQHEYGIYGGQDGDQVLAVIDGIRVPSILVAHAVLAHPTAHQRYVLEHAISGVDVVVTMTEAARERLLAGYAIDHAKVVVIPHGAPYRPPTGVPTPGRKALILTWGLLGPGKGIEWAIDGLHVLRHLRPHPAYIIAGQTHPQVRRLQGESYRLHLGERARAVGVSSHVRFTASYLDEVALTRLIRRADVILLPFDSHDQVTSGVLVEAVAAGKPVVATTFPHAVEILSSGAGLLVPHHDGAAIGAALHRVLTEPEQARRMATEATRLAPALMWTSVADKYRRVAAGLLETRTPVLG